MNAQTVETQQAVGQQEQQNALLGQIVKKTEDNIIVTEKGLDYTDFNGLWRLSKLIFLSKLGPKDLDSIEAICVVIAKGRAVGLEPFVALESIGVVNGRPLLFGDAPLAICRHSPFWDESGFDEWFEQGGKRIKGNPVAYTDDTTAFCQVRRKGEKSAKATSFSVADAKTAGLWGKSSRDGKPSPWTFYPQRMLMFRARGYRLRDSFGDALKGLGIRELFDTEPIDIEVENAEKPSITDLSRRIESLGEAAIDQEKPGEAALPPAVVERSESRADSGLKTTIYSPEPEDFEEANTPKPEPTGRSMVSGPVAQELNPAVQAESNSARPAEKAPSPLVQIASLKQKIYDHLMRIAGPNDATNDLKIEVLGLCSFHKGRHLDLNALKRTRDLEWLEVTEQKLLKYRTQGPRSPIPPDYRTGD